MRNNCILILLVLSICAILSCKKESLVTTSQIVGKWTYVKDSINYYKNSAVVNKQVVKYTNGEFMNFNPDGSGSDSNGSYSYTLSGNTLTLNYAQGANAAHTEIATVQMLNNNKLNLYYDFVSSGNNSIYASLIK